MPFVTGQDLVNATLFEAGESSSAGASAFRTKVLDYLNKSYRTLCAGTSEFMPAAIEDWWWLRSKGVLTLLPIIETGTVTVTQDSATINLSSAPSVSVADWMLRVEGHPEVFQVAAHTAAANPATLESAYTGPSGSFPYKLMKVFYALGSDVASLISPMIGYRGNSRITGITPEGMDNHFPVPGLAPGVPTMFSLENTQTVRFNKGGRTDGQRMKVDYRYRPIVTSIADSPSSSPLVPLEYRHILVDMAVAFLLRTKNDARDQSLGVTAANGLKAMVAENRRRLKRMDSDFAHIFPRQSGDYTRRYGDRGPLRTDSGLIIG